jgi:hypothetical protein
VRDQVVEVIQGHWQKHSFEVTSGEYQDAFYFIEGWSSILGFAFKDSGLGNN